MCVCGGGVGVFDQVPGALGFFPGQKPPLPHLLLGREVLEGAVLKRVLLCGDTAGILGVTVSVVQTVLHITYLVFSVPKF